jgi:hypothetical protein
MSIRPYLPSAQFAFLVLSLFISVGLVYGAQMVTKPHNNTLTAATREDSMAAAVQNANWQASLNEIQAQSGAQLPDTPNQDTVNSLRQAAKSDNLTDSVGRTLLVNLTNAKAQGLGDDIPTQNQLLAYAKQQLTSTPSKTYKIQDLQVIADSPASLHTYGNAVMHILTSHPLANMQRVLQILAETTDTQDPATTQKLIPIQKEYKNIADLLAATPVPKTLSPFHLELINEYERLAGSFDDMRLVVNDPLRGLQGLQVYQSAAGISVKVFTNIAQALNKNGILFKKDEPGAAWAALLSAH